MEREPKPNTSYCSEGVQDKRGVPFKQEGMIAFKCALQCGIYVQWVRRLNCVQNLQKFWRNHRNKFQIDFRVNSVLRIETYMKY